MKSGRITISPADADLLDWLVKLEESCFRTDRLSRRSMRRFILSEQTVFLVAHADGQPVGYAIILFHRGTRLARLYSIAVDPASRGRGIARALLEAGEEAALQRGAIDLRLEVGQANTPAIELYRKLGFREFGLLRNFYEDQTDALRMQKRIRRVSRNAVHTDIPWLRQHTPFTCGPAALMMAMAGINPKFDLSLKEELRIWRETTTIYMTSGHGGCHPLGLALAARRRNLHAEVWINKRGPLFMEGVRSDEKKKVIQTVHSDFLRQSEEHGIPVHYRAITQKTLRAACDAGAVPIILISTYRLDRRKAPHWVVVSGYDDRCFYVHDPDFDEATQVPLDLQYVPIAAEDFGSMSSYGGNRLRSAIILSAGK